MGARAYVVAGPTGVGKTNRLLDRYRRALISGQPGCCAWIAPTVRSAHYVRGRLLDAQLRGCFRPGVTTFERFAEAILLASNRPVRPVTGPMKRQLLAQLIQRSIGQKKLEYFGPVADCPGLLDAISQAISELKRREIWPEDFLEHCHSSEATQKDRELWHLYDAYQKALLAHDLFDEEGRFWSAHYLLQSGQRAPYESLKVVVVDGFTDFTRTQHEILQLLAGWVDEMWVSLPIEAEETRSELFAKPRQTLEELRGRLPDIEVEYLEETKAAAWPALQHLNRHLFGNPRVSLQSPPAERIELLKAPQQLGEIELVGRRIKQLLISGDPESGERVRPGDIAVVFRSCEEVAPLVREVFSRLGLPLALESTRSLGECPALRALVAMLQLQVDDWPFRQLLTLLEHRYFRPDWPEWADGRAATAADHAVRQLQIPRGRDELLQRLERRTQGQGQRSPAEDASDHPRAATQEARDQQAVLAAGLLHRLAAALDRLPGQGTLGEWAQALAALVAETGVRRVAEEPSGQPESYVETAALERLFEALTASDRLFRWLGEPSPILSQAEALTRITDLLNCECLPEERDETGRVRVLSAPRVRTLHVPYLFIAGLSERSFPSPERFDRLYANGEHRRLIAAGLPLADRNERRGEEMLLFYELLGRATRRLYLSYPAVNEQAQPLLPSPYLAEVERLLPDCRLVDETSDLRPIALRGEVSCFEDLRIHGADSALNGQGKSLASLAHDQVGSAVFENLLAGFASLDERETPDRFGPHEGLFVSGAARQQLAKDFPSDFCWSPSQLEDYIACPFRFYLAHVLQLESPAELALEDDYRSRGSLLHAVMATLHRRLQANGQRTGTSTLSEEEFSRAFGAAVEECLRSVRAETPIDRAWREIDRRLLQNWAGNYLKQHQKYDAGLQKAGTPLAPAYFEVAFGPTKHREGADEASIAQPLELRRGNEVVRLAGRIDRVDVHEDGGQRFFAIVDYKSGSAKTVDKMMKAGAALQLPLYALAVEQLLFGPGQAEPIQAAYWFVKDEGCRKSTALRFRRSRTSSDIEDDDGKLDGAYDWPTLREETIEQVFQLVQAIRDGQFPVFSRDDECTGRCPYKTACRINQVRAREKTWAPSSPAMA